MCAVNARMAIMRERYIYEKGWQLLGIYPIIIHVSDPLNVVNKIVGSVNLETMASFCIVRDGSDF